jgi:Kef-type K+ transport system membrane component KefB
MVAPLIVDLLPLPPLPPIVAEILAGIIIGPQLLDVARVDEPVHVLAQIGLVFLFFLAGLELSLDPSAGRILRGVAAAFAVSFVAAVVAAHLLEALGLAESPLLVAIILAATAFGIVVAVLKDAGEMGTSFGQLVILGASVADFSTVVLLSLFFSQEGSGIESTLVLLATLVLAAVAAGFAILRARRSERLVRSVSRLEETSAQIGVRITFVLLIGFVFMAEEFGLEVVLGAFLAGAAINFVDRDDALASSGLDRKLAGIGFGVFIPVFFVAGGMQLDLGALFDSPSSAALVPAALLALLVVRGVPALLYRVERRQAMAAGLLQATSLPFVVAAAQIGVELDKISEATAAGLVAAGVLSVLLFPVTALALMRRTA